jgi:hypothetical protein
MVCHFCGKACTVENLCHGCKEYVCETCDTNTLSVPWGPHAVEYHDERLAEELS